MATKTDVGAVEWAINDEPFQLRPWAEPWTPERGLPLPMIEGTEMIIGSEGESAIRIVDVAVSRRHASLKRENGRCVLRDLDSKNGVGIDGFARAQAVLTPGVEVRLGTKTFVAESSRFVELRSFISRVIGWSEERLEAVALALRAVRVAASRRAPLVICGEGDLVALAHDVHRRVLGVARRFIVCDPRRETGEATVRSPENYESGVTAVEAARGGSVCVWAKRLPRDYPAMRKLLHDPAGRVQLIVCAHRPADGRSFEVAPLAIVPLAKRVRDLGRIVDEYAREAGAILAAEAVLASVDREWLIEHSAKTLPDIEKGTLRVTAIRKAGSILGAAELLGMSHTALLRWLGRRRLPVLGRRASR